MSSSKDDPAMLQPEPPPIRVSSSDVPPSMPMPQAARVGGGEGGGDGRRDDNVKRAGIFERAAQFLSDVRAELGRVVWPSATEVKNTTIITLVAVIFFAVYLFAVDRVLTFLVTQLEYFVNWLFGAG